MEEGFHVAKSKETQALPSIWILWHKEKRRKEKGGLLYMLEVFFFFFPAWLHLTKS